MFWYNKTMAIKYDFCPQCKTEMDKSGEYPHCPNCNITIYKNSKPTAGILLVKDGKVLLSKRAIDPFKGSYDIIGGFLNNGEHPEAGVVREAKEETGLDVKPNEILGIYVDTYGQGGDYTLNIHYIGEVTGGEIKAMDDVSSLHWVDINELPLNEGFKNTKEALKDLQIWYKNKSS